MIDSTKKLKRIMIVMKKKESVMKMIMVTSLIFILTLTILINKEME